MLWNTCHEQLQPFCDVLRLFSSQSGGLNRHPADQGQTCKLSQHHSRTNNTSLALSFLATQYQFNQTPHPQRYFRMRPSQLLDASYTNLGLVQRGRPTVENPVAVCRRERPHLAACGRERNRRSLQDLPLEGWIF